VLDVERTDGGVAFNNVKRVAMIISSAVKPRMIVLGRYVDNQCVALPVAIRPSHPGIGGSFPMMIQVDGAHSVLVLIDHEDFRRSLKDLKGKRHVIGARHTRPVTLQ